jgi:hypothetical protein
VIPTAIAGNLNDGYAIGSDGNLYAWGYNGDGELGNGTATGPDICDSLGPCGTTPARVLLPLGVSPTAIAGGAFDGYAIGSDAKLYAWGYNAGGELGNGTTTDSSTPVVVSFLGGSTPVRLAPGPTSGSAYAIASTPTVAITISTTFLPPGTVAVPYSVQLEAVGGTPPYTWNKYPPKGRGVLPLGLHLWKSGLISGTPKRAGTYTFTVKCLDTSHSHKTQATQALTLTINP